MRELRIHLTSVFVDDQEKAHEFYTRVLGFKTKHDIPLGDDRWLTLTAPDDNNGVELLLERSHHPAVGPFRNAMAEDGIPVASFAVDNLEFKFSQLEELGVRFTQPPVSHEGYATAIFDDTCGNLIQLIEFESSNGSVK